MLTEGLGGVEGTVRPDTFPRAARVFVPGLDAYIEMQFDERGQLLMTYEAWYNLSELLGWTFEDKGKIDG